MKLLKGTFYGTVVVLLMWFVAPHSFLEGLITMTAVGTGALLFCKVWEE